MFHPLLYLRRWEGNSVLLQPAARHAADRSVVSSTIGWHRVLAQALSSRVEHYGIRCCDGREEVQNLTHLRAPIKCQRRFSAFVNLLLETGEFPWVK